MTEKAIYLDHSATSLLLPCVRAKIIEVMDFPLGNASSLHSPGHHAHEIIEESRKQIARLINASPEEIIFTSGGSESNNTVANIFAGQKIAVSAIEHPAMLASARARAGELLTLDVDSSGSILPATIPKDANLVSVMFANNELGTIEPVQEIVKRCKKYNTYVHTDAVQALGKVKIDVQRLGVDYMTLSAHKIGGPIGIGALYVKKGSPYRPLIFGGHQESGRRAGTMNTLLIAGFGAAAKWCWDNWSCKQWAEVAKLRDELRERILKEVPYSSVNSPEKNCLPHLLNVSFQAAEGESIQLYLDIEGIYVGTGSACAAGDLQPSHVLMATKNDAEVAHSSIRFSLGLDTTKADITRVMAVLPNIVKKLQGISTVKIKEQNEPS